jgi:hypothetical protein
LCFCDLRRCHARQVDGRDRQDAEGKENDEKGTLIQSATNHPAGSGVSGATLIEVGTDHRLADPEPLAAMLQACEGSE